MKTPEKFVPVFKECGKYAKLEFTSSIGVIYLN